MERVEIESGYRLTAGFGKVMVGLVNGEEVARIPVSDGNSSVDVIGETKIQWVEDYEKVTEIWTPTENTII